MCTHTLCTQHPDKVSKNINEMFLHPLFYSKCLCIFKPKGAIQTHYFYYYYYHTQVNRWDITYRQDHTKKMFSHTMYVWTVLTITVSATPQKIIRGTKNKIYCTHYNAY